MEEEFVDKIGYRPTTRLIPLTKWEEYHTWPSENGLRFLVQHAKRKMFLSSFRKVSGRILIDEAAFFKWAEKHDEKEKVHGREDQPIQA